MSSAQEWYDNWKSDVVRDFSRHAPDPITEYGTVERNEHPWPEPVPEPTTVRQGYCTDCGKAYDVAPKYEHMDIGLCWSCYFREEEVQ